MIRSRDMAAYGWLGVSVALGIAVAAFASCKGAATSETGGSPPVAPPRRREAPTAAPPGRAGRRSTRGPHRLPRRLHQRQQERPLQPDQPELPGRLHLPARRHDHGVRTFHRPQGSQRALLRRGRVRRQADLRGAQPAPPRQLPGLLLQRQLQRALPERHLQREGPVSRGRLRLHVRVRPALRSPPRRAPARPGTTATSSCRAEPASPSASRPA